MLKMRKIGLSLLILFMFSHGVMAEVRSSSWEKFFGGSKNDEFNAIQQTSDGGYIVAGYTESFGNGGADAWVIRLDKDGNKVWDKTFGGAKSDVANAIQQTFDGGYIVAGYTESFGNGGTDVWVIKLDKDGNKVWDKTFGGEKGDIANSIQQTSDGGYIVAGYTESFGNGGADAWVIRLDKDGNKLWDKTFGGEKGDVANSIQQTSDGGYIVAGYTESFGNGGADAWVIKLDKDGNKVWDKTFGGLADDVASSILQITDGGFIIAGYMVFPFLGMDVWVIRLDKDGNMVWNKTFGGTKADNARSIQQTKDGGFVVAGFSESFGKGTLDAWVIKLDKDGNKEWDKTFGGKDWDVAKSIQQTKDGGYIIAGFTESFGAGGRDGWVIKLEKDKNQEK